MLYALPREGFADAKADIVSPQTSFARGELFIVRLQDYFARPHLFFAQSERASRNRELTLRHNELINLSLILAT